MPKVNLPSDNEAEDYELLEPNLYDKSYSVYIVNKNPPISPENPLTQTLYIKKKEHRVKGQSNIGLVHKEKKWIEETKINSMISLGSCYKPFDKEENNVFKSIIFPSATMNMIKEEDYDIDECLKPILENIAESNIVLYNREMSCVVESEIQINQVMLYKHEFVTPSGAFAVYEKDHIFSVIENCLVIGADISGIDKNLAKNVVWNPVILWQYKKNDSYME